MNIIERARALRPVIEQAAAALPDDVAKDAPELFPAWNGSGVSCTAGQRVRYGGALYKVLTDHFTQADWTPDNAPGLIAKGLTDPVGGMILAWVQPDSTNPYMIGDRVIHEGQTWICTVDNNVWVPGEYGWSPVAE